MNYMENLRKFSAAFFLSLALIFCVGVMDTTAFAADDAVVVNAEGSGDQDANDGGGTGASGGGDSSNAAGAGGTNQPENAGSGDSSSQPENTNSGDSSNQSNGADPESGSTPANDAGSGSGANPADSADSEGGADPADDPDSEGVVKPEDSADSEDGADPVDDAEDIEKPADDPDSEETPGTDEPQPILDEEEALSKEVQNLLNLVSALPDSAEWDTADSLLERIALCQSIYDALTEDEKALGDVASALARFQALKSQVDGLTITQKEGKLIFTLHRDGTAAVTGCDKENWDFKIDIPETVSFEDMAYRVTAIGNNAFNNIWAYAQLTLPEGLETIGDYAFSGIYLYGEDLVIPDSVTSIGNQAFCWFNSCASDQWHINKIVFGSGLKEVSDYAFWTEAGKLPVEVEFKAPVDIFPPYVFNPDAKAISKITVEGYKYSMDFSGYTYLDPEDIVFTLGLDLNHAYSAGSLQEIINEVANSETKTQTIAITKGFIVSKSIVIPTGVNITLTDDGQASRTIEADSSFHDAIFFIEKGGTLIIDATADGGLVINGNNSAKLDPSEASVFQVNGQLILKNGKINGGIADWKPQGMFSGVIVLGDGAKFSMTGGTISGAYTSGAHSAPIIVASGAEFNMSGGTITENYNYTALSYYSAGAVLVYGWNASDVGGKMTLSGNAVISNNKSSGLGGGAITLVGNAQLIMDGGKICNNTSSRYGGGICVAGPTQPMQVDQYDAQCVFIMNGGEISYNKAKNGYGGGIYINSNHVTLNAGDILYNTAGATGGGIYVETPHVGATATYLKNAVITGNYASVMGGGMYFCPTGTGSLYVNEGSAIFDNTADGAADDFVSVVLNSMLNSGGKTATLAQRVLGGGLVNWYWDGAVYETAVGGWGSVVNGAARYNGSPDTLVKAGTYSINLALKAILSDDAKALAEANCTLRIEGNTAMRGGGVGSNGSATAGDSTQDEWTVAVNKTWDSSIKEENWKPVKVQLVIKHGDKEYALDTVELNAENDWNAEFTGLPASIQDSVSVKELIDEDADYYADYRITQNANVVSIAVTNIAYSSLTIQKQVTGDSREAAAKEYSFTVTGPDGYEETVIVKGGQSVTLKKLLAGTYRVTELRDGTELKGYYLTVNGEGDVTLQSGVPSNVTITNNYQRLPSGSLTVVKNVIGGGTAAAQKVYTFSISGPDGYSNTITITGSGSVTLEDLTPGDYTVTEDDADLDGYTWNVSGNGVTVTVKDILGAAATITNTYTSQGGSRPDPDPTPDPDPEDPPVDIPDEDPPLVDIPEEEPPLVDVPEEEPPLVDVPEEEPPLVDVPDPEVPTVRPPHISTTRTPATVEIPDESVPLADVPETGDNSGVWCALALAALAGFVCLTEKKRAL